MLILTGCAAGDVYDETPVGYVPDAPAIVAGVDWTKAQRASIALNEYDFAPERLVFQRGTPYRLHLENRGDTTHTFTSEGFFKAIAARELETPQGTVEQPLLKTIAVAPGEAKELTFVPVEAGEYELECSRPFHAVFGMTGVIRIE